MAEIVLVGSSQEDRERLMGELLNKVNPLANRRDFDALWDIHLLVLHHKDCSKCCRPVSLQSKSG